RTTAYSVLTSTWVKICSISGSIQSVPFRNANRPRSGNSSDVAQRRNDSKSTTQPGTWMESLIVIGRWTFSGTVGGKTAGGAAGAGGMTAVGVIILLMICAP